MNGSSVPSQQPGQQGATRGASASPAPDPAAAAALSGMLTVTHAAVYAAGAAGGALAPFGPEAEQARALARTAYTDHRRLRDDLVAAILAHGGTPPAAQPAYRLPIEPTGVTEALALLADIEDRSAVAAHEALSALQGTDRELAVDALVAMAMRAQRARLTAGLPLSQAMTALPGA